MTNSELETSITIFITAMFIIVDNKNKTKQKNPRILIYKEDGQQNQNIFIKWNITHQYKENELLKPTTAWMNLTDIILSQRSRLKRVHAE